MSEKIHLSNIKIRSDQKKVLLPFDGFKYIFCSLGFVDEVTKLIFFIEVMFSTALSFKFHIAYFGDDFVKKVIMQEVVKISGDKTTN